MIPRSTLFPTRSSFVCANYRSQRPASAEEIVSACMYLALPSSKSTNGTSMIIDGGWIAQ
jgi:hypothetical protein